MCVLFIAETACARRRPLAASQISGAPICLAHDIVTKSYARGDPTPRKLMISRPLECDKQHQRGLAHRLDAICFTLVGPWNDKLVAAPLRVQCLVFFHGSVLCCCCCWRSRAPCAYMLGSGHRSGPAVHHTLRSESLQGRVGSVGGERAQPESGRSAAPKRHLRELP